MDKIIVTGMLLSAAVVAAVIVVATIVPTVGDSSQSVVESMRAAADRKVTDVEVIGLEVRSDRVDAWVKNVGVATIDAIDKSDLFLLESDGGRFESIAYYGGAGDNNKTWTGDLVESGLPWDRHETLHISIPLAGGDILRTCEHYSLSFSTHNGVHSQKPFMAHTVPTVAIAYNPDRPVRDADTLVITATSNIPINGTLAIGIDTPEIDLGETAMTDSGNQIMWTYSYDVPSGSDGTATISIPELNDCWGTDNATATNNTFVIDNTLPRVTVEQAIGQADPTNASTINFTVTFDEDVTGFADADVTLSGTAGPTTSLVTGGPVTYTVAVSDMASDGTVIASLLAGVAADAAGNPSDASTSADNQVTYDTTAPTVSLSYDPDRDVRDADTLTVTATFGEAINGTPTIAIDTTETDLPATAMEDSGDQITWTYTYDVPSGSDGTATVTIAGATDDAGNPNAAATNNTFTIDNISPAVSLSYDPDRDVRDADTLTITATFDQPIFGTPTIAIDTTGQDLNATAMTDSGNQVTWTYTYDVPSGSDGTATVTIAGATDDAGNPNAVATNNTFTIDNTVPTVTVEQAAGQADPTNSPIISFTVSFDEDVTGFDDADVTVGGTAGATTGDVSGGPAIYNVAITGMSSDGTVIASLFAGVAADAAGNTSDASTSADNQVTYDTTAPTVSLSYDPDRDVRDADTVTITATFGEAINGTPTIAIDTSGTDLAATAMSDSGDQITWTYEYDVPSSSDGNATVAIAGATDDAGNANATATNNTFTIDNISPAVSLSYAPDRDVRDTDTLTITATFNQAINGTPTIAIDTTGTDLAATDMNDSGDQVTWTYTYDVPSDSDGTATVTIAGATDVAGNLNNAATNNTFTIDNTAPTVALTYSKDPVRDADTLTVTATFGEAILGEPTIAIDTQGTDLLATAMTDSGNRITWTYSYDVPDASDGTATVTIAGATDEAGNANDAATNNTFIIDNTAPTVTVEQAAGQADPTNSPTINFTVTFDEDVTGFENADVTLSGTAGATTRVVSGGPATYNVAVTGVSSDGTVIASLLAGVAADAAGNISDASTSADNQVTYDTTAPTVSLSYDPDRDVRDADTLTITATFDEAINGTPTIAIDTTGTVLAATAMTDSDGQVTWTYTYDVPSDSDGTATVTIAGATDDAGNANATATNNTFTIDNTGPTVALSYAPDRDVRDADTLTITATFSQAINGTPTIVIDTSGTDLAATAMTDSDGQVTWTYTYDVPSGSDGTATVTIAGATDDAGNPNDDATNNTFTIDNIAPTVSLSYSPNRDVRDADTITIRATFGEAINGTPRIAIDTQGTDLAVTDMTDSGNQVTWTYSYDVPSDSDGTATVTIAGATDDAGNANAAATNNTFIIDNTAPTVALSYAPDRDVRDADTVTITATFGEAINGTPTIAIDTQGTDLAATDMSDSGDQVTWTYTYDVPSDSDGTATVTIAGATDEAGNANDAATNSTFTIDNTGPTVSLSYAPDRDVRDADTLTITATFNQAINGTPTIAINTTGTDLPATAMSDSGDQITWTYSYDVPSDSDGTATITIAGATDEAGNANATATDNTFTVDNTAPTVSLSYAPDRDVRDADTLTITATFSEAVSGTPTIAIDTQGTDLAATDMSDSGDQITWTYSYDVTSDSDGTATVTIADATDEAGNANAAASNNTFTIDNTAPTVVLSYNPDRTVSDADTLVITATFSDAVSSTPTIAIDTTGTDLDATAMSDSGDQVTWTYSYDVPSASNGTATVTISDATDETGNAVGTATNNTFTIDNSPPTVTVHQAAGQADPASSAPINFTVTFSEDVTGFTSSDVPPSGTSGPTASVVSGGPAIYNVAVSGMSSDGTVQVRVLAGVAFDDSGNGNLAFTTTDNRVTYDAP